MNGAILVLPVMMSALIIGKQVQGLIRKMLIPRILIPKIPHTRKIAIGAIGNPPEATATPIAMLPMILEVLILMPPPVEQQTAVPTVAEPIGIATHQMMTGMTMMNGSRE
jgi:hypothetical protein